MSFAPCRARHHAPHRAGFGRLGTIKPCCNENLECVFSHKTPEGLIKLRTRRFTVLWLIAVWSAVSISAVQAASLVGRVVAVAYGDTVTLLDDAKVQHKVRLAGIDAPEKDQPFGDQSKKNLSQLVFGKDVRVEWSKRYRYQRIVGKVWAQPIDCSGCPMIRDAGHAQVTVGLAWWYRKYASEQSPHDRGTYEHSEAEAKARRVGLWRDTHPVPPWEWRQPQIDRHQ